MPVEVRRIAARDWLLLRDLRLASLADAPQAFGQRHEEAAKLPDEEWQQTARASTEGERRAWFLAQSDAGAAVGLVQARRRPSADCLLFSMWVTPEARGRGVGRALVEAVAEWGAAWGAQRVVLWVYGANHGAQRFYERLGFTLMPEGPDAESGAAFGALALELSLTA